MIKRLAALAFLLVVLAASYVVLTKNTPDAAIKVDQTSLPTNGMVGGVVGSTTENGAEKANIPPEDTSQTTLSPEATPQQPAQAGNPSASSITPPETDDLPRDAEVSEEPAATPVAPKAPAAATTLPPSEGQ